MKKVTITYTRQNLDTPWYWQISSDSVLNPMYTFIEENHSDIETYAYVVPAGNKNIVTFTFSNEQVYQDFRTVLEGNIATGYVQYCQDNNITIETVVEDI